MTRPQITVINDDPDFLDLIQDLVEDTRNYNVHVMVQGLGAIEQLKGMAPDVVVLDIRLEYEKLGYHILEGIRRDPKLQQIPVIVCTADTVFLETHQGQLRKLGTDWLEKPFDINDLLKKIDAAVARADSTKP